MPDLTSRRNRRAFLAGAAAMAGGVLSGCTILTDNAWRGGPLHPILPSPVPRGAATPRATPVPGGIDLDAFLAMSAVLTGFEHAELNPVLGRTYLTSLETRANPEATLAELYQQTGFASADPPDSVEALEEAGLFDNEALGSLADTIMTYWYTGIYDQGGEQVVATYVDALTWQAIAYTKPRTICGPFPGFWRERPPIIP